MTPRELRVKGEQQNVLREMAIYLTRRLTRMNVEAIGRHFGGVKASSISKCIRRFENRMRKDPRLEKRVRKLARMLQR